MAKTALVPVADGTEEIEAVVIIDVLRRAGVAVTVASVMDRLQVTASRGVMLTAEKDISGCVEEAYDLVALPGGIPGARHLAASAALGKILDRQRGSGRLYGAICAAPAVVLRPLGLLEGLRATCHPAFRDELPGWEDRRVVVDGTCVTSQGPGTAIEFALSLVALLLGEAEAEAVAGPMIPGPCVMTETRR
ncbi:MULTISPECIES: DJ-1 family glyoxalase III [Desulfococcus]|jgi:4-methyl-5(b-hydroxyethyl)-thiazole monophosphate biosynthesis|uniref:DJ-1 family protein n=1 Tax=Desulfococcus multivorans DSM 2059 TaxID=1121405 RepID=S7TK85_DESML|nr:DJ-1 family glyoxalase III [Desulfococcus multivorans]AQV02322.1 DJ-1 family protein [Desulfococcus multivorans]EPR37617.1 DJ-1 family protein [Desulfococcus multivorans DSM 2059]MDX9818449.1 DJ-1/PfpI family protein [Desulfococcus multivorans]SKA06648.1 DJ-1 family protein [Desulfococcus multivorans DSM 2059]